MNEIWLKNKLAVIDVVDVLRMASKVPWDLPLFPYEGNSTRLHQLMHMVIHLFHIVAVQKKFNIYNHRTDKVDT
jgi:hypothetical protein